jgi:hypothetical protein
MEFSGIDIKTGKLYQLDKKIIDMMDYVVMNHSRLGLWNYHEYRILLNQHPQMASIDRCFTIYNILTQKYYLIKTNCMPDRKPFGYRTIKSKYLYNDNAFTKVMAILKIKNPIHDLLNQVSSCPIILGNFPVEIINTIYDKYSKIVMTDDGKFIKHPETKDDGLILIDDYEYDLRIGKFMVEGPLFIYDKEREIMQQVKVGLNDIDEKYNGPVARLFLDDSKFYDLREKREIYNKSQDLLDNFYINDVRK